MEIIPAIDIINGQCVRLEKGDYARKKLYHEDPISVAKSFEEAGIKRLHLVDLDGAKSKNCCQFIDTQRDHRADLTASGLRWRCENSS